MSHCDYLVGQFIQLFPNASAIIVEEDLIDETIDVGVCTGDWHIRPFHMDIESDDDCFTFTNTVSGETIKIPFPAYAYGAAFTKQAAIDHANLMSSRS